MITNFKVGDRVDAVRENVDGFKVWTEGKIIGCCYKEPNTNYPNAPLPTPDKYLVDFSGVEAELEAYQMDLLG